MTHQIPKVMRALVLESAAPNNFQLTLQELPVPTPQKGQVLIRMDSSPINPSDTVMLNGGYFFQKLPCVPGNEGSGTVIAYGGGLYGWSLMGKRVACAHPREQNGCWAEYMVTDAILCVALPDNVSFQIGSSCFVNPLTVCVFMEILKMEGHKAAIQTAAASQLGRMFIQTCRQAGVPLINVVRRQEQVDLLRELGAQYILNSSDNDFDDQLQQLAADINATVCFEAIAGEMPGRIIKLMPPKSILHVYGILSGWNMEQIQVIDLLFNGKEIKGLFMPNYLEKLSMFKQFRMMRNISNNMNSTFKSEVSREVGLENFMSGYESYMANMTGGKVLVRPFLSE